MGAWCGVRGAERRERALWGPDQGVWRSCTAEQRQKRGRAWRSEVRCPVRGGEREMGECGPARARGGQEVAGGREWKVSADDAGCGGWWERRGLEVGRLAVGCGRLVGGEVCGQPWPP